MVNSDEKHLLFIEPKNEKSVHPVNDGWTAKMLDLLSNAKKSDYRYKGFHWCVCGEESDNFDHFLPNGVMTNSLAVHYLQYHRDEVPQSEFEKLLFI